MGKAPAPQFYVKDWLSDMKLNMCSHSTKGIWMDFLCFMYWEKTGGFIEGEEEELKKMVRATTSDFDFFLVEAERHKFCDILRTSRRTSENVTPIIRVINRRLYREEKKRENDRLRKRKQRVSNECHNDIPKNVTLYTPTPSPTPTPKKNAEADKSVSSHWTTKLGSYLNDIHPVRDKIYSIQPDNFNVDQWVQMKVSKHGHPKAILVSLTGLKNKALSNDPPKSWFAYIEQIFKIQNGNCVNEDKVEVHTFYKTMEISGEMKKFLAGLVKGVE